MTRYREILRMYKQNISQRAISSTLECSRNTVSRVIQKAQEDNLQWSDIENMSDQEIEKQLFPDLKSRVSYYEPDFEYVHKELARSGVTLFLLWLEYSDICRDNNLLPYKYAHFCKLYNDFTLKTKATMRIVHKPGEKMEVDWAGKTLALKNNINGSCIKVYIFVATLPYSGYSYVEGFLSMNSENWIQAHINSFNYFHGVSKIIIPDNLKTGVDKVKWINPVINRAYADMAVYYDTAIIPARVRKPKDKPSVEGTVGVITSWIIAALRDITFFYLYDLNEAIRQKLLEFNKKPF